MTAPMTTPKNPAQFEGATFETYPLEDGTVFIGLRAKDGEGMGVVVSPHSAIENIGVPIIKAAAAATAIALYGNQQPGILVPQNLQEKKQ